MRPEWLKRESIWETGTNPSPARRLGPRLVAWLGLSLCLFGMNGCAALTNPVEFGIPVRRVPPEYLASPRETMQQVPISLLRLPPKESHKIAAGDLLGIYIDNILSDRTGAPPVQITENGGQAIGFPFPVREDGTLTLPLLKEAIPVAGKTLEEAQQAIIDAYTKPGQVLIKPDSAKVIVSLIRERRNQVFVLRQDSGGGGSGQAPGGGFAPGIMAAGGGGGGGGNTKRGTGVLLDLPASESDVLTALTRTGGLPGLDAKNEVLIFRGQFKPDGSTSSVMPDLNELIKDTSGKLAKERGISVVRIPLRLRPGEAFPFSPSDIELKKGDIVFIETRDSEVFYVGGLLPSREVGLPREYDLDIVEAIALVGGTLINGGVNANNIQGNVFSAGIGSPSPTNVTVIRRIRDRGDIRIHVDLAKALQDPRERILVQAQDIIILQETWGQTTVRYLTNIMNLGGFLSVISSPDASVTGSARFP
jgi:protein involved in polysaccharide export with SLBB domain